ncbi:type II CAAX endopeptidase family protein [Leptospira sp. 96542]|nr:type II CAAX endopeptidase family protein [Leptospira sp. 96542]
MQNRFFELLRLSTFAFGLVFVSLFFYTQLFSVFVANVILGERIPEEKIQPIFEDYSEGKMDFSTMFSEFSKIKDPIEKTFLKEFQETPQLIFNSFYDLVFLEKPHLLLGHSILWLLCYVILGYIVYKKFLQIPVNTLQDDISIRILLRGIGYGFICYLAVNVFGMILVALKIPVETGAFAYKLSSALSGNGYLLAWGVYVVGIITGILEELFFRGFLLKSFADKNLAQEGLLIISLLFGFLHRTDGTSIAIPFILSGVGLFFGYIYLKSNNIWIAIACHATYNSLGLLGAYFQLPGIK